MATISRYDVPAEAPVLDTYVPIPFQELSQAALARQQKYEEGLALQENLETELGSFKGLDQITLPTGEVLKVGDRARVLGKVQKHLSDIDEMASIYPDKSSPEFRAKIRSKIREIRADRAPTGIFGRAESNVAELSRIQKMLTEHKNLKTSPHLATDIYRDLKNYAAASQQGMADLSSTASIGEEVDVQKELTDLMKNMGTSILGESYGDLKNMPGFKAKKVLEGITFEDAYRTALSLIGTNKRLSGDLQMQAAYAQDQGYDVGVEDLAKNMATSMAQLFKQNKQDFDIFQDPYELARYKKNLEDETGGPSLSEQVVIGKPGQGYKSPDKLDMDITTMGEDVKAVQKDLTSYMSRYGISVENPVDAEGVDHSTELNSFNSAIDEAMLKQKDLQRMKDKAMKAANITPEYFESTEFQRSVLKAKQKAGEQFDRVSTVEESRILGGSKKPSAQKEAERNAFIEENYGTYIKDVDTRYQQYAQSLQDLSNTESMVVGVYDLPSSLKDKDRKFVESGLNKFSTDYETATKAVKDLNTGGDIYKKDFEKLDFTNADLRGYFYDADGVLKLAYVVPSKEKTGKSESSPAKEYKAVKVTATGGLEDYLLKNGYIDDVEKIVSDQLHHSLGAAANRSKESIVTLGIGKDNKNALQVKVVGPDFNPDGNVWSAYYPREDGGTKKIGPFTSLNSLVGFLSNAYKNEILVRQQQEAEKAGDGGFTELNYK